MSEQVGSPYLSSTVRHSRSLGAAANGFPPSWPHSTARLNWSRARCPPACFAPPGGTVRFLRSTCSSAPLTWSGDPNFVVPPFRRGRAVATIHDLTPLRFPQLCTASTLAYPALIIAAARRGAWFHTPTEAVADEVRNWLPAARIGSWRFRLPSPRQRWRLGSRRKVGGRRAALRAGLVHGGAPQGAAHARGSIRPRRSHTTPTSRWSSPAATVGGWRPVDRGDRRGAPPRPYPAARLGR